MSHQDQQSQDIPGVVKQREADAPSGGERMIMHAKEREQSEQGVQGGQPIEHEFPATRKEHTTCCIVGAGPAGAMLAFLLARQSIPVVLLEAQKDFARAFRGDTLHPSVMEILDEVGLAGRLLDLPHTKLHQARVAVGSPMTLDFSRLHTTFPYITVIAQERFLTFLTEEAKRFPHFRLLLEARVDRLIEEEGIVRGVSYHGRGGTGEIHADLTVGADGRFSRLRHLAAFHPIRTSSPMDILWFRLSRRPDDPLDPLGLRPGEGLGVVFINRLEYWQIGLTIPKGGYQQLRTQGLASLRQTVARAVPELADRVDEMEAWKQLAFLLVESSRLVQWYKPGLLLIGDAAHVMSPVGGVGINYAIADAVVASNVLGAKLHARLPLTTRDLAQVQHQRELPTRVIQTFQALLQRRGQSSGAAGVLLRGLFKIPWLRSLPARLIGFGLRPPHVKPKADVLDRS